MVQTVGEPHSTHDGDLMTLLHRLLSRLDVYWHTYVCPIVGGKDLGGGLVNCPTCDGSGLIEEAS